MAGFDQEVDYEGIKLSIEERQRLEDEMERMIYGGLYSKDGVEQDGSCSNVESVDKMGLAKETT